MQRRFIVNPFKCIVSTLSCIGFLALCGCMFLIHRPGSASVFFVLALIFGVIAALSGTVICLDETGIQKMLFGRPGKKLLWTDIAEIGVAGTKVFNQKNPKKAGSLYIYFSENTMTEQERFEMMLQWPPKDKFYLIYDDKRYNTVLTLWNQPIKTYNIGSLIL